MWIKIIRPKSVKASCSSLSEELFSAALNKTIIYIDDNLKKVKLGSKEEAAAYMARVQAYQSKIREEA